VSFAFWVHNLSPFLIRFNENFGIRYYGLSYLLGFLGAGWLLHKYYKAGRSPLDVNAIFDLMTALIAGVIIGGRLGYFLLYQPEYLFRDPMVFLRVWEGGMASHGGMLGVVVALWAFTRRRTVGLLQVADLVVSTAPLGLFFGRIANFINGELWGIPSRVPWAVIFPASPPPLMPRHPSQLYEAGLEGLLLFAYMQGRFWKSESAKTYPGQLSGEFLLLYAFVRALGEFYREPDAGLILGLSRGTFYSVFLVAAGVALLAYARRPQSQRKA
jgi:phosphatidylglycerol:prolipoprotein diacylglycerol transferase